MINCVTSSILTEVESKGDKILYQMKITYDDVTEEDSNEPAVLVMEWKDRDNKEQREHIFLREISSMKHSMTGRVNDSNNSDICQRICSFNGKKLNDGEMLESTELCIEVTCHKGKIFATKLKDCDRKLKEKDIIVFPDDFV